MHVYIYDNLLDSNKYRQQLAKIETRITDLGLNGKIIRLNPMHNIRKTINDEAKIGRTLVFVGSDKLLNEALAVLAYKEVPIGYIPFFSKQPIAEALGIPEQVAACDVLAARRIIKIDLAKANDHIFIGELLLTSVHNLVDLNNEINIEVDGDNTIKITNLSLSNSDSKSNPFDGLLELEILTQKKDNIFSKTKQGRSYFCNNSFTINSNNSAIVDKCLKVESPITVSVMKSAVELIVGKERRF